MKNTVISVFFLAAALAAACSDSIPTQGLDDPLPQMAASKVSPACTMEVSFNGFWLSDPTLPFYWGVMTVDETDFGVAIYYFGDSGKPFLDPFRGQSLHWAESIVTYGDDLAWDPVTHAVTQGTAVMTQSMVGLSMPNGEGVANGQVIQAAGPFVDWLGRNTHLHATAHFSPDGFVTGFSGTCGFH